MLIKFNFENYKGFKDYVSLDMLATSLKEHQYNLIDTGDDKLLKIAAIYGANASGKTTVLDAFHFMASFVRNSFKNSTSNIDIPLKRFAFDKDSKKKPSEFEVFIKYKNNEYQYGFKMDDKKILEEWLYKRDLRFKKNIKYNILFEREGKQIDCSQKLKEANGLKSIVEDNTLFLSICSNAKIPYVKDVMEWFSNTIFVNMGNCEIEAYLTRGVSSGIENREYQKEVVNFLNAIDISIEDIYVEKMSIESEKARYNIYSCHKVKGEKELVKLPFTEESSGTQKMFAMYNLFKHSIEKGLPIFIDELDAKLHPLLMKYILSMFHSEETNSKGAQLIYTAHDDFTLSKDVFRRDQIWFVEKDIDSVATLYSLAEYKIGDKKVRNDASYSKDYLAGKYGAIPILNKFEINRELEHE